MKKLLVAALVIVMAMGLLSGCAKPVDKNRDMVVMVTDMGGVNDKSFNQSAWEGLQAFGAQYEKEKIAVSFLESTSAENYVPNLSTAVQQGSDLTWAIGYMMADQLDDVAAANANSKFAIIDSAPMTAEEARANVAYVTFKEHEGSFLVGMIAGLTTKTNKVGFVGGMSGGLIEKFEVGFKAGVLTVNPDAVVTAQYAESWTDDQKGEQIATTMIKNSHDVIYHAAGGVGVGVARACQANEVWFIGVDKDQSFQFPDNPFVLTSMLKRVDEAVTSVSKDWADGKFPGGSILSLGLKENGVGYVDSDKVAAEIKPQVEEFSNKIKDGSLVVPSSYAELETYQAGLK